MDADFWHQKWEKGEIGFHIGETNPLLIKHFERLNPATGGCIFLPLCGKTRDIAWLLARGYRVVGAELSELAVQKLFEELGVTPQISRLGKSIRYSAMDIDIWVGDIFDVSAHHLGIVHAIYDRAALVALPAVMRESYVLHLMAITGGAPQLLLTYEYDQESMEGPPFSVGEDAVRRYYDTAYSLSLLESRNVPGGFRGKVSSKEHVWLLQKA